MSDDEQKAGDMICSACPFCSKTDTMPLIPGHHIPCDLWNGGLYRLKFPWLCAVVSAESFSFQLTEKQLFEKIRKKGGEDSLMRFKQKLLLLKNKGE